MLFYKHWNCILYSKQKCILYISSFEKLLEVRRDGNICPRKQSQRQHRWFSTWQSLNGSEIKTFPQKLHRTVSWYCCASFYLQCVPCSGQFIRKGIFTCWSEVTLIGASLSCSTKPCTYQKPTGKEAFSPLSPQLPPLIRWSIINTPINFLNK